MTITVSVRIKGVFYIGQKGGCSQDNTTKTISGRRVGMFLRHDNYNIGKKRRGCSDNMTIRISSRRGGS